MNNYRMGTKCVQAGYKPGNGEPRQIPIIQSTTFKYAYQRGYGKTISTLKREGYFYSSLAESYLTTMVAAKIAADGGWNCSYAHFFRTGSQFHGSVQYL